MKNKMEIILNDVRNGKPIVLVDSYERENEGDVMIAAEKSTATSLAFFARYARGITCLPCTSDRLDRLKIPMMHSNSLDKYMTPFANSIDASYGISTGVSAEDRQWTVELFVSETSVPGDFAQPGHLFPLRARKNLLLERQGHTEASIQLCLLAGMKPVAVICEVMNDDGSMSRIDDLNKFCKIHKLNMISIDEIIEYVYPKKEE